MKILIVNGNTTEAVTQTVAKVARLAVPGAEISGITASFGADLIASRADVAIAEHATLAALARSYLGFDAALIAVSMDTGLRAARQTLPIPVIGMTEAALHMACFLGSRFGLVTFDFRCTALYRELVEANGLIGRLAEIEVIDSSFADVYGNTRAFENKIADAATVLISRGAEVIILCGAAVAGVAARVESRVPVPILDGIVCGVLQAEALGRLKARKPSAGSYAWRESARLSAVDASLSELLQTAGAAAVV
jgi:allantoin racemase